jgi:hypothetical protein
MSDTIKSEEASAVEVAPALTPRSDLPQSPACRPGGSPYVEKRDEIDDLVDEALAKGPRAKGILLCPHGCGHEWHGLQNESFCQGSHI